MKTETTLIVGALAIAAALVLIPKRPRSSASGVSDVQRARVGAGDASTVWGAGATSSYREQLRRQSAIDPTWTGP